jgi:hypothetical protein
MDMIWYDSEVFNGRGTRTEFSEGPYQFLGPVNKMELPCITCDRSKLCSDEAVECKAFKVWSQKGEYSERDIGLKLKAI